MPTNPTAQPNESQDESAAPPSSASPDDLMAMMTKMKEQLNELSSDETDSEESAPVEDSAPVDDEVAKMLTEMQTQINELAAKRRPTTRRAPAQVGTPDVDIQSMTLEQRAEYYDKTFLPDARREHELNRIR